MINREEHHMFMYGCVRTWRKFKSWMEMEMEKRKAESGKQKQKAKAKSGSRKQSKSKSKAKDSLVVFHIQHVLKDQYPLTSHTYRYSYWQRSALDGDGI